LVSDYDTLPRHQRYAENLLRKFVRQFEQIKPTTLSVRA
jgi:hypothetical protein